MPTLTWIVRTTTDSASAGPNPKLEAELNRLQLEGYTITYVMQVTTTRYRIVACRSRGDS